MASSATSPVAAASLHGMQRNGSPRQPAPVGNICIWRTTAGQGRPRNPCRPRIVLPGSPRRTSFLLQWRGLGTAAVVLTVAIAAALVTAGLDCRALARPAADCSSAAGLRRQKAFKNCPGAKGADDPASRRAGRVRVSSFPHQLSWVEPGRRFQVGILLLAPVETRQIDRVAAALWPCHRALRPPALASAHPRPSTH